MNSHEREWRADQTQEQFMKNDQVILVDDADNIVGAADKFTAHRWQIHQPPPLHRAFSVFLFNGSDQLLLQRRSAKKITFPGVWTNTCCSHPLSFEQEMEEQDHLGVKRAAIRKLHHELGIDKAFFKPEQFKFLTRVKYSAPYIPGYGEYPRMDDLASWRDIEWGEHEIDYILLLKMTDEQELNLKLEPNPEEVEECKFVSRDELYELMRGEDPKFQHWSPWFCKIVSKWYDRWLRDINQTYTTNTFVDSKIWEL